MAIALKNKRKITVNQKQYAWSVGEDYDSAYILCNIGKNLKKTIIKDLYRIFSVNLQD